MSLKATAAKIFAYLIKRKVNKWASKPIKTQEKVFFDLLKKAKDTAFGRDHHFSEIKNYEAFKKNVPIRDYEDLRPYIDRVVAGETHVLWPGKPMYFAKTSGTTSGAKYIPITKASIPSHIENARNAILLYIAETNKAAFVDGKMIFLQGSPVLQEAHGIKLGRLSGIAAHYVPKYLQKNRLPSWETNCIDDWETKVSAIVDETKAEDMRVISGIPSWVQMYFERLEEATDKKVGDLFKNFNLFIYGGVNFEPYRAKFKHLIGREVDSIELYPASEGFFAYQDSQTEKGMLLQLNSGMFYEFVKASEFFDASSKRMMINEVALGVNYVMLISSNAGLWAYNVGDTVMFTSLKPYRIVVSGRIKHFISAFGEHVIGKEVEQALKEAVSGTNIQINEFTVAPQVSPKEGQLPHHEWLIEFGKDPENLSELALKIDLSLQEQNKYYQDLISGKILQPLRITPLKKGSFYRYMKAEGKLGGQNKIPRLSNDRVIAENLLRFNK